MRSNAQSQKKYKDRLIHDGFKRVQIWRTDENNERVKERIKRACKIIDEDYELMDEITSYTHNLLQDTPV